MVSLQHAGIDVHGRTHRLRVNYRTTAAIRATAERLTPAEITYLDEHVETRQDVLSLFNGAAPEIHAFESEVAERAPISVWP